MKHAFLVVGIMLEAVLAVLTFSCTKTECPPTVTSGLVIDSNSFIKINIPTSRISTFQVQSNNSYTDSTSISILANTVSISITPDTIIYTYNISRAYFKLNYSDVPKGFTIGKATLLLFTDDTAMSLISGVNIGIDTIKAGTMALKRITSSWNPATLSWNNQPFSDTSNQAIIPFSKANTTCLIDFTKIAKNQYNDSINNNGMVLELITEVASRGQVFYSEKGPVSVRPQIKIEYY